jgi:hypothetical protein
LGEKVPINIVGDEKVSINIVGAEKFMQHVAMEDGLFT